jgi:hypothetical protein
VAVCKTRETANGCALMNYKNGFDSQHNDISILFHTSFTLIFCEVINGIILYAMEYVHNFFFRKYLIW